MFKRIVAVSLALAAALALSACTLSSQDNLVAASETVELLGAGFTMVAYKNSDGAFTRADDGTNDYALVEGGYVDSEGEMTVYFVPRKEAFSYLLAIEASDGTLYGVARLADGIMTLQIVFDGDPEAAAQSLPDLPAGVTFADGGVMVTDRASLDAVIERIVDGSFQTNPLVAWVGNSPPPVRIVPEGDWFRPEY